MNNNVINKYIIKDKTCSIHFHSYESSIFTYTGRHWEFLAAAQVLIAQHLNKDVTNQHNNGKILFFFVKML